MSVVSAERQAFNLQLGDLFVACEGAVTLEKRGAAAQLAQVPPSEYSFLWSRDVPSLADGPRLLRFHLDRNLSSPTEDFVSPSQRPGAPCRTASGARDEMTTPHAAGMRRQGEAVAAVLAVLPPGAVPGCVLLSAPESAGALRCLGGWAACGLGLSELGERRAGKERGSGGRPEQ